jgi:hypothetical protein
MKNTPRPARVTLCHFVTSPAPFLDGLSRASQTRDPRLHVHLIKPRGIGIAVNNSRDVETFARQFKASPF